nr:PREDICTED: uncharacterized protein LOC105662088 [Megachile rotundata]
MVGAGSGRGLETNGSEKGTSERKRKGCAELWRRGVERRGERGGWVEEKGRGRRVERLEPEPEAGRRSDVDVGDGGGSDGDGPDMAEASRLPEVAEEMKCLPAS